MLDVEFKVRALEMALDLRTKCDDDLVDAMENATTELCDEFDIDDWDGVWDVLNTCYIYGEI